MVRPNCGQEKKRKLFYYWHGNLSNEDELWDPVGVQQVKSIHIDPIKYSRQREIVSFDHYTPVFFCFASRVERYNKNRFARWILLGESLASATASSACFSLCSLSNERLCVTRESSTDRDATSASFAICVYDDLKRKWTKFCFNLSDREIAVYLILVHLQYSLLRVIRITRIYIIIVASRDFWFHSKPRVPQLGGCRLSGTYGNICIVNYSPMK